MNAMSYQGYKCTVDGSDIRVKGKTKLERGLGKGPEVTASTKSGVLGRVLENCSTGLIILIVGESKGSDMWEGWPWEEGVKEGH
jgi:hypothetical protein